jgi:hypothetical protein
MENYAASSLVSGLIFVHTYVVMENMNIKREFGIETDIQHIYVGGSVTLGICLVKAYLLSNIL